MSSDSLLMPYSHQLFDEYTRRQFLAKAPEKNPFGTDETAARFADFDVFTKVHSPLTNKCMGSDVLTFFLSRYVFCNS